MSTICADHQLYHRKSFKDIEIPPRKLLMISKKFHQFDSSPDSLCKYFPCNDIVYEKDIGADDHEDGVVDSGELDPYSSDHFRMYEFKVRRCTRSRSHDWTDCPFAHPGEKARRRDPRKYHYSGTVCPEFRHGGCSRGDNCEFAHGVFECWLHPSRYRTEACKDGKNCRRKICFFAHTPKQLRILPEVSCKTRNLDKSLVSSPCSCCLSHHSLTAAASPTSTLLGLTSMSPPLSPSSPLSPAKHRSLSGYSPISRLSKIMNYKNMVSELMSSLEAMSFGEVGDGISNKSDEFNIPWIDASFDGGDYNEQQQFVLSPSTPSSNGSGDPFNKDDFLKSNIGFTDEKVNGYSDGLVASNDPDLGWVNELVM